MLIANQPSTIAGGMLNGYQTIPRQQPSYANMAGAGGDFYAQNRGLLGNAAMPQATQAQGPSQGMLTGTDGRNVGGVQVVEPTDIYTATQTDPNAPVAPTGDGSSGLTMRDYLAMMTGADPAQLEYDLQVSRRSLTPEYDALGLESPDLANRTSFLDSAFDREKAQNALKLVNDTQLMRQQGAK
jgi:hypothetical protein